MATTISGSRKRAEESRIEERRSKRYDAEKAWRTKQLGSSDVPWWRGNSYLENIPYRTDEEQAEYLRNRNSEYVEVWDDNSIVGTMRLGRKQFNNLPNGRILRFCLQQELTVYIAEESSCVAALGLPLVEFELDRFFPEAPDYPEWRFFYRGQDVEELKNLQGFEFYRPGPPE